MEDSFRSTRTLDFLSFERPGTAQVGLPPPVSRPPSVFGSTQTSSFQSTETSGFSISKSVKPLSQSGLKSSNRPVSNNTKSDLVGKSLKNCATNIIFMQSFIKYGILGIITTPDTRGVDESQFRLLARSEGVYIFL